MTMNKHLSKKYLFLQKQVCKLYRLSKFVGGYDLHQQPISQKAISSKDGFRAS